MTVDKGVHRIAAAAWNRGGNWGLRVSLNEPNFGPPIVDDDPDWEFHGRAPPADFEPPECASEGCAPEPVMNLSCEVTDEGLILTWENPPVVDPNTPTRIEVDDGLGAVQGCLGTPF